MGWIHQAKALEIAQKTFSITSFRDGQEEIFKSISEEKNVFGIFPTSFGKSLCYQLPTLLHSWRTIVIFPILALLEDQYQSMVSKGIGVTRIHSELTRGERDCEWEKINSSDWQFLFITPEQFLKIRKSNVQYDFLVIDEAHCLWEWQHFRKAYAELLDFISNEHAGRILCLSATVSEEALLSFQKNSKFAWRVHQQLLGRDNLFIQIQGVEKEAHKYLFVVSQLRQMGRGEVAIIYCTTRDQSVGVASFLQSAGIKAEVFHAGLPVEIKKKNLEKFLQSRIQVICATSAFGMGINHPNVRKVIHWSAPLSLSEYWQEVGRAGRSGTAAEAITLVARADIIKSRMLESMSERKKCEHLWEFFLSCECRKQFLEKYFSGRITESCGYCDVCLWKECVKVNFEREKFFSFFQKPWWMKNLSEIKNNFSALLFS